VDLRAFLERYTDEVYGARDPDAARRFVADPCLRHEAGELVELPLSDNVERIAAFLVRFPDATFTNRVVTVDGEYVTAAYEFTTGDGAALAGIEIFRVRSGLIIETWNAVAGPGRWG
jgi:hypothetical protein